MEKVFGRTMAGLKAAGQCVSKFFLPAGRCDDNGECSLAEGQGQWSIEALGHETFDFGDDMNHAHVQPTGEYHYHGMPCKELTIVQEKTWIQNTQSSIF